MGGGHGPTPASARGLGPRPRARQRARRLLHRALRRGVHELLPLPAHRRGHLSSKRRYRGVEATAPRPQAPPQANGDAVGLGPQPRARQHHQGEHPTPFSARRLLHRALLQRAAPPAPRTPSARGASCTAHCAEESTNSSPFPPTAVGTYPASGDAVGLGPLPRAIKHRHQRTVIPWGWGHCPAPASTTSGSIAPPFTSAGRARPPCSPAGGARPPCGRAAHWPHHGHHLSCPPPPEWGSLGVALHPAVACRGDLAPGPPSRPAPLP